MYDINDQNARNMLEFTVDSLNSAMAMLEENKKHIANLALNHAPKPIMDAAFDAEKKGKTAYIMLLKTANSYAKTFGREVVYSEVEKKHYISYRV